MISVREVEWAAGFLEGEGCFSSYGKGRAIRVAAPQVQREPLEKLQRLFGGHLGRKARLEKSNQQSCFRWQVGGKRAAGIMMTLFSLLSSKRKWQIQKALCGWLVVPPDFGDRVRCPHGHPYTGGNLVTINGSRYCRTCKQRRDREAGRRHRLRIKDKCAAYDLFPGR